MVARTFPRARLIVVGRDRFAADRVVGVPLEVFLRGEA